MEKKEELKEKQRSDYNNYTNILYEDNNRH